MKQPLHVAVVCGGRTSEHEVSRKTGWMVLENLDRQKYRPVMVTIGKNGKWRFGNAEPVKIDEAVAQLSKFDFVFIAMHGAFGEDGRFQALLEWIGVPYSGSGVLSSAMAMDKEISNKLYEERGLLVPRYAVVGKGDKHFNVRIPLVVKPADGGSSVGISIVKLKRDLPAALRKAFKESACVMLQEYIKGREFTCGVLEDSYGKPFVLPPTEIIPKISSFFDYRAKYFVGGSLEVTPPKLPRRKIAELQRMALTAHRALACQGMSRSDFILRGSNFYILETNTIPGMTKTSLLPQAAKKAGISFTGMLNLIIAAGLRRQQAAFLIPV